MEVHALGKELRGIEREIKKFTERLAEFKKPLRDTRTQYERVGRWSYERNLSFYTARKKKLLAENPGVSESGQIPVPSLGHENSSTVVEK